MSPQMRMEIMKFIAAAVPANDDRPTLRLARQERVDQLLHQLNHSKPRATVYFQPEHDEYGGFREAV